MPSSTGSELKFRAYLRSGHSEMHTHGITRLTDVHLRHLGNEGRVLVGTAEVVVLRAAPDDHAEEAGVQHPQQNEEDERLPIEAAILNVRGC